MLTSLNSLLGHRIHAADGPIGVLDDFYFDDSLWVLRYFVVDVGGFLRRRRVLLSPVAVTGIDPATRAVSFKHSIDQIKNSPDIDTDKPVYRQMEEQLVNYYQWVPHWTPQHDLPEPATEPTPTGDTHLRSLNNVRTYTVMAFDGRAGSIEDFILDADDWRLPLVVLDTTHYLSKGHVVIPSTHVKAIRVEDEEISIGLYKADVEASPVFDPTRPLEEYLSSLASV